MTKVWVIALTSVILILGFSGCGYKAPPFYEKPTPEKGSTVAL